LLWLLYLAPFLLGLISKVRTLKLLYFFEGQILHFITARWADDWHKFIQFLLTIRKLH
jgi:hypothetical protein